MPAIARQLEVQPAGVDVIARLRRGIEEKSRAVQPTVESQTGSIAGRIEIHQPQHRRVHTATRGGRLGASRIERRDLRWRQILAILSGAVRARDYPGTRTSHLIDQVSGL